MNGQAGLTTSDTEDIQQSLFVKLLQNIGRHDPSQAPIEVFARTIVHRHAANIVRDRRAAKRDPSRSVSLHVTVLVDSGEVVELAQQISQRELDARIGVSHRDEHEQAQLEQDVAECIAGLPYSDRELMRALKQEKIAQIARRTGIPRTTLHGRVRRLRKQFEDASLREYLP